LEALSSHLPKLLSQFNRTYNSFNL